MRSGEREGETDPDPASLEPSNVPWMEVDASRRGPTPRPPTAILDEPLERPPRRTPVVLALVLLAGGAAAYALQGGGSEGEESAPAAVERPDVEATEKRPEILAQEERLAALAAEVEVLAAERDRGWQDVQTLLTRRNALEQELADLELQRVERVERLSGLEGGPDGTTDERQDLERQRSELDARQAELEARESELVRRLGEQEASARAVAELQQREKQLRASLRELQSRHAVVQRKVALAETREPAANAEEQSPFRRAESGPRQTVRQAPRLDVAGLQSAHGTSTEPHQRDSKPRLQGFYAALAGKAPPNRVFVHYSTLEPGGREVATGVARRLSARGFNVVQLRPVRARLGRSSVRFYYDQDGEAAPRLYSALAGALSAEGVSASGLRLQDMRTYSRPPKEGTIEVWVAGGKS